LSEAAPAGAGAGAVKHPAVPQPASTSPCMVKTDLREFVSGQFNLIAGLLALNPAQSDAERRLVYKWPTRSHGSQVGGSLTKITDQDGDGDVERACKPQYRSVGRSKKN